MTERLFPDEAPGGGAGGDRVTIYEVGPRDGLQNEPENVPTPAKLELVTRVRKTVLFVTHDLAEAFHIGDRVSVMRGGRVVQTGTENELRDAPADAFVREFVASATEGVS